MKMRMQFIVGILLIAATLVVTAAFYPRLPDNVPIHWNTDGSADHYAPKWSLLVVNPAIMAGVLAVFFLLPWLSPRHFEVDSFRSTYLYIMLVLLTVLAYFHGVLLWVDVSGRTNANRAIIGGVCLMVALLGGALGRVRRNFYLGVRTPWTIANEDVWNATHRLAAKLFVVAGLAGLTLLAFGVRSSSILFPLLAAAVIPVVYSLVLYKRLEHQGKL
jgi:uncharacterized membrane protein